jgi:hypothetical protein
MADAQDKEERRKREERERAMDQQWSEEEYWYPNRERTQHCGWNPGYYFACREWPSPEISKHPGS